MIKSITPKRIFRFKTIVFIISTLSLIVGFSFLTFYEALSADRVIPSNHCEGGDCCIQSNCACPSCDGRGEPGDNCDNCGSDSCEVCGNCNDCGTNPCPFCRDYCYKCGFFDLCDTCNGCPECGHNRDPLCPECDDDPVIVTEALSGSFFIDPPTLTLSGGGFNILLFAPFGTPALSILSALFTIIGVVVSLLTIIQSIRRKKAENDELDKRTAVFHNADSFVVTQTIFIPDDYEVYNKQRRNGMLVAMYILSTGAVLLLAFIQNFYGVIVVFDWWSIIHAVIFAGILICQKFLYKKHNKEGALICLN